MTTILFLLVLAVLVFVHELGHFLAAKAAKVRVDEFAVGFPPRVISKTVGETAYSLNLIPFGGYVKIYGEDPNDETADPTNARSMSNKPRIVQAGILAAGVIFNVIFAWIMLSLVLMIGYPTPVPADAPVQDTDRVTIVSVMPDSPAADVGIKGGDVIEAIDGATYQTVTEVQTAITAGGATEKTITVLRNDGSVATYDVVPELNADGKPLIGIALDRLEVQQLPWYSAIGEGFMNTMYLIGEIAKGLGSFVADAFRGEADTASVAGPVGIATMVGDASALGFTHLLTFTAFISLNLAVLNIMPFPALDGGRLLFLAIEAIIRKPLPQKFTNTANLIGFSLLMLLIVVVTFKDIAKLIG